VGRQIQSGSHRTVKVGILHEKSTLIASTVTIISNELRQMHAITERWTLLLTRLKRRWLGEKWLPDLPEDAQRLLSG
jgi:hypothetical protein